MLARVYQHLICPMTLNSRTQVFVRGGLQALIVDSPEHSERTNTKNANASTHRSCQRCKVPRRHLGNPRYDFRHNHRTAEGVDADIEYVKQGATRAERVERGKQRGVVAPKVSNPLKKLTFDRQLQVPFDVLHADSLVSSLVFCLELHLNVDVSVCSRE